MNNETLFRKIRNHLYGSGSAGATTDDLITELKEACTIKYRNSPETISRKDEEIAYLYLLYKKKHEETTSTPADFSYEELDTEILLTATAPVISFFYNLLLGQESPTYPEPTTKVDGMKVEDIAHVFTNYMSPNDKVSMNTQRCHHQICVDLPRLNIGHPLHPNTYSLISAVAVEGKELGLLVADQPTILILRFAQLVEAAKTLIKTESDASTLPQETQADLIALLTEFTNDEELIKMEIPDQGERLTSEQLIETLRKHADVKSLKNLISITFDLLEGGQKARPEAAISRGVNPANAEHIDNDEVIQSWIKGHKEEIACGFVPFLGNVLTPSISEKECIPPLRTFLGQALRTASLGWDIRIILYKLVQEIINGPKCKENALDTFKKIIALMVLAGQTVRHTQKPATIASIRAYRESEHASKIPENMKEVIREIIHTVQEIDYACPAKQIDEYREEYHAAIDILSDDRDEDEAPDSGRSPSFFARITEFFYRRTPLTETETEAATKIQRVVRGREGRKVAAEEKAKAKAKAAEKRLLIEKAVERLWPSTETLDESGHVRFFLELKYINDAEKAAAEKAAAEKSLEEDRASSPGGRASEKEEAGLAKQEAGLVKQEAGASAATNPKSGSREKKGKRGKSKPANKKQRGRDKKAKKEEEAKTEATKNFELDCLSLECRIALASQDKDPSQLEELKGELAELIKEAKKLNMQNRVQGVINILGIGIGIAKAAATEAATRAAAAEKAEAATRAAAEKAEAADSPLRSKTISGETALPFLSLLAGAWCELPLISISASKVLFPLHAMKALDQTTPFMAAHLTATTLTGLLGAGLIYIALSAAISSQSPEHARAMKHMGRAVVLAGIIAGISSLVLALSAAAAATTAPTIAAAAAVAILAGLISASIASWQEQRHGEDKSRKDPQPTLQAGTTAH